MKIIFLFLVCIVFSCGQTSIKTTRDRDSNQTTITDSSQDTENRNYLDNDLSLRLEKENIQAFFDLHKLTIKVTNTKNVNPYRIFLHEFTASEAQIREIINILKLDSVTPKDFKEIHTGTSNTDFKIHSPIGLDYIKNSSTLFYKSEADNKTTQKKLKVTKAYLYYNRDSKKACFQTYYAWG